jgi:hypothetical protein
MKREPEKKIKFSLLLTVKILDGKPLYEKTDLYRQSEWQPVAYAIKIKPHTTMKTISIFLLLLASVNFLS